MVFRAVVFLPFLDRVTALALHFSFLLRRTRQRPFRDMRTRMTFLWPCRQMTFFFTTMRQT